MEEAQIKHADQLTQLGEQLTQMGEQLTQVGEQLTQHGEHLTNQGQKLARLERDITTRLEDEVEAAVSRAASRATANRAPLEPRNAPRPEELRKPPAAVKPHRLSLLRRMPSPAIEEEPEENADEAEVGSDRRKLNKLQGEVRRLGGRLSDLLDRLDQVGQPAQANQAGKVSRAR